MVAHLDQKVDRFRKELAARITGLKESVNERFNMVNSPIDALDDKARQLVWLVGIQIAVLVAVVSALIAALLQ